MKYFIHFTLQNMAQSMSLFASSRNEAYTMVYQQYPNADVHCIVPVISEYEFPE